MQCFRIPTISNVSNWWLNGEAPISLSFSSMGRRMSRIWWTRLMTNFFISCVNFFNLPLLCTLTSFLRPPPVPDGHYLTSKVWEDVPWAGDISSLRGYYRVNLWSIRLCNFSFYLSARKSPPDAWATTCLALTRCETNVFYSPLSAFPRFHFWTRMYVHLDTPSSYALAKEQQNLTCQNAVVTEVTSKYTLSPFFLPRSWSIKKLFWFTKACKQLRLHYVVQEISVSWENLTLKFISSNAMWIVNTGIQENNFTFFTT